VLRTSTSQSASTIHCDWHMVCHQLCNNNINNNNSLVVHYWLSVLFSCVLFIVSKCYFSFNARWIIQNWCSLVSFDLVAYKWTIAAEAKNSALSYCLWTTGRLFIGLSSTFESVSLPEQPSHINFFCIGLALNTNQIYWCIVRILNNLCTMKYALFCNDAFSFNDDIPIVRNSISRKWFLIG